MLPCTQVPAVFEKLAVGPYTLNETAALVIVSLQPNLSFAIN